MTEEVKKAIDFAADVAKQMVTLSTGIVTITLLFSKDIVYGRAWALAAWICFLVSTLSGLWTLMSLTGTLLHLAKKGPSADKGFTLSANVLLPARFQVLSFILAIILTIGFVISTTHGQTRPTKDGCCCCSS